MSKEQETVYSELNNFWSIQESLLQSYRTIFIMAQSIVFAVATTVATTGRPWLAYLLAFPGMYLMTMWTSICQSRGNDVSFVHWMMLKMEDGTEINNPMSRFKEFQRSHSFGEIDVFEDKLYRRLINSETRMKMDTRLPNTFWSMWVILTAYITVQSYLDLFSA